MIEVEMAETTGSSDRSSAQLLSLSRWQKLLVVFIISLKTGVMPSLRSF